MQDSLGYEEAIRDMLKRGKAWKAAHPTAVAQVQFNYPKEVGLVAAISDALKAHFISANPDGLELLKAMSPSPWPSVDEPTALMVRIVFELMDKPGATL